MSTGIARVYDLIEDYTLSEMDIDELDNLNREMAEVFISITLLMKRIGDELESRKGENSN